MKQKVLYIVFAIFISFTKSLGQEKVGIHDNKSILIGIDTFNNPYKITTPESLKLARHLYEQHCEVCHGKKGKGDGEGGFGLEPPPNDLTSEEMLTQTDGFLFWKISYGVAPMSGYRTRLDEKDRWMIIEYVRTLQKNRLKNESKHKD